MYICTHIYVYMHTYTYICTHIYVYMHTHIYIYVCTQTLCIYIYIYMCTHIYVYIYAQCLFSPHLLQNCRIYCTQLLNVLVRAGTPAFLEWGVEFLVTQLYDRAPSVAVVALKAIDEACDIEVSGLI